MKIDSINEAKPEGNEPIRALDLFCGIGGFSAALGPSVSVLAAVDINRSAVEVLQRNFAHPVRVAAVESLSLDRFRLWEADFWWMSPPCQPFTRRGKGLDQDDPRNRGLQHLLDFLREVPPKYVAVENVPEFAVSEACDRLRERLDRLGFQICEKVLCPTALGLPNRRRRFYLVASRTGLRAAPPIVPRPQGLADLLEPEPAHDLWVDESLLQRYRGALNIVDADDPAAVTACFTSAYGRSPVRSGSYLRTEHGVRRFSPAEILRLLGFSRTFSLPDRLTTANAWRLAGNSLSLPAVRTVLAQLPPLSELGKVQGIEKPRIAGAPARDGNLESCRRLPQV